MADYGTIFQKPDERNTSYEKRGKQEASVRRAISASMGRYDWEQALRIITTVPWTRPHVTPQHVKQYVEQLVQISNSHTASLDVITQQSFEGSLPTSPSVFAALVEAYAKQGHVAKAMQTAELAMLGFEKGQGRITDRARPYVAQDKDDSRVLRPREKTPLYPRRERPQPPAHKRGSAGSAPRAMQPMPAAVKHAMARSILQACAAKGDRDGAREAVQRLLPASGENDPTLAPLLLRTQAEAGEWEAVLRLAPRLTAVELAARLSGRAIAMAGVRAAEANNWQVALYCVDAFEAAAPPRSVSDDDAHAAQQRMLAVPLLATSLKAVVDAGRWELALPLGERWARVASQITAAHADLMYGYLPLEPLADAEVDVGAAGSDHIAAAAVKHFERLSFDVEKGFELPGLATAVLAGCHFRLRRWSYGLRLLSRVAEGKALPPPHPAGKARFHDALAIALQLANLTIPVAHVQSLYDIFPRQFGDDEATTHDVSATTKEAPTSLLKRLHATTVTGQPSAFDHRWRNYVVNREGAWDRPGRDTYFSPRNNDASSWSRLRAEAQGRLNARLAWSDPARDPDAEPEADPAHEHAPQENVWHNLHEVPKYLLGGEQMTWSGPKTRQVRKAHYRVGTSV
jgi:hypothetical protein